MGQKISFKNMMINKTISIQLGLNPKEFNCFKDFIDTHFPEEKNDLDFENDEDYKQLTKEMDEVQDNVEKQYLFNKPLPKEYEEYADKEKELDKEEKKELEEPLKIWLPKIFNDVLIPLPEFKALSVHKRMYIYMMFKLSLEEGESTYETFFDKDLFDICIEVLNEHKDTIPYEYKTFTHYVKSEKKTIYVIVFTIKTPDIRVDIEDVKERAQLRQIKDFGIIYEKIIKHKPVEVFSNPVLAHIIPKLKGKISSPWYSCGMFYKVTI